MHLNREAITRADRRALRAPLWVELGLGAVVGVALVVPMITLWLALNF